MIKPFSKRSLSLTLAAGILLLALAFSVSAGAEAQSTISAVASSSEIFYTGSDADAFRVAIDLSLGKDEPGISVYVVTVRWDPDALELIAAPDSYEGTGCYFTDAFSDGWNMIPNGTATLINTDAVSRGQITVTSGSAANRARSDGTLFVLNFRPKKAGVSTKITVTPGSSNVAPSAALSSASGRITNVTAETTLSLSIGSKPASGPSSEPGQPESPALRGDIDRNGQIDAPDYLLLKRAVLGTFVLAEDQLPLADVDCNGQINELDYLLLKRHVLGTYVIKQ